VLSAGVKNERNVGGMVRGETDEDPLSGFGVPFRNRLVVLKLRVQDINWTAENMSTRKRRAIEFQSVPELFRGPACTTGG
jgi:hypothetical protein